jgi:hypothetical protein
VKHYFAVRPISMPEHIRIEKAESPVEAIKAAFGRGSHHMNWQFKDLGTKVSVIQSDRRRISLLKDPKNWKVWDGKVWDGK